MNIGGLSRPLAITVLFVLIFVSATTVLDTYAKKMIIKKPIISTGKDLTKHLADRTKTTEIQIEKIKIAKLPYKIEYRDDLLIKVDKYTHEFNTDLFNSLMAKMVAILPYLIS